jgi:hypothetical protein
MHYTQTQVFLERIKIPIVVKQKKAALDAVCGNKYIDDPAYGDAQ